MSAGECTDLGVLVSAYADGELEGEDLARAEAHLSECASCRARVEAYREMDAAAADVASLRAPDVGPAEWDRRRGALVARAEQPRRSRAMRIFRRAAWTIALGAAAAIIIALLFPGGLSENGAGDGAEIVSVEAADDYTFAVNTFEDSVAVTFVAEAGDLE